MNDQHHFEPRIEPVGHVNGAATIEALSNETSVYAASPAFVRQHCGPIANTILDAVDDAWFARCEHHDMLPNIDVRVHRLNIGEYPAVPGWHCDGVLRETFHGQPDINRIRIRDTIIATVASDPNGVSTTEWVDEPVTLTLPGFTDATGSGDTGYRLWRGAHQQLEQLDPQPRRQHLQPGKIICMGERTLHRATPATTRGWRLFFRMSMWHNPYLDEHGKVARQQHVYVVNEAAGW